MQHIIQHLFSADSLADVPRERLETLVNEYPSFSLGRYLLSSKLRAENADDFAEETRKTNLYFTNPFWLQWLLQQESTVAAPVAAEEGSVQTHFTGTPVEEAVERAFEMPVAEEITTPVEEPHPEPIETPPEESQAPAEQYVEQSQPEFAEPVAEQSAQPPLVFESYHMIDYFASQGIKLAPDENPSDRLGKQMKSFTEWLKVMKRLPQKEALSIPDPITENKIQAIAAHSIESREVVTETMAEVLAQQGMREKASEVYHKLSLLNPDKSGYFAAKIEQLKTN